MVGKGYIFTKTSHHFCLHISHKAAKSMAKLSSQSCGELQHTTCQGDMQPFESDLSTRRFLISLRNKPQQKQLGKFSAPIPACIVSQCVQLSFAGEKCVLLLCARKPAFLKSSCTCECTYMYVCMCTSVCQCSWLLAM